MTPTKNQNMFKSEAFIRKQVHLHSGKATTIQLPFFLSCVKCTHRINVQIDRIICMGKVMDLIVY